MSAHMSNDDASVVLERVDVELQQAAAALSGIPHAMGFREASQRWSAFLSHLDIAWEKLERLSRDRGGRMAPWAGRVVHERRTDPLLQYLWQARNADYHGLSEVLANAGGTVTIGATGPGLMHVKALEIDGRGIKRFEPGANVSLTSEWGCALAPVVNLGVTYDPPMVHLGRILQNRTPLAVGLAGAAYYRDKRIEASRLVADP